MSSHEIDDLILAAICVAPFVLVSVFIMRSILSSERPEK